MWRRVIVVVLVAIVAALTLNVGGLVRYPGGPLREANADGPLWLDTRPPDQGASVYSNTGDASWAMTNMDLVFSPLQLVNDWPWSATIESVTPLQVTGSLAVREARLGRPGAMTNDFSGYGPATTDEREILDADYEALPGAVKPGETRNLVLVVRASQPGRAGFEALAVEYRIGPFSFRVVHHLSLHACLGSTPSERNCPPD